MACSSQQSSNSSEIEETLKRIQSHKGVVGVVIINNEGKLPYKYISFFAVSLIMSN